jgi:hypothetical protein
MCRICLLTLVMTRASGRPYRLRAQVDVVGGVDLLYPVSALSHIIIPGVYFNIIPDTWTWP